MKIVIVIDSWNNGNGCIVTTHRLVEELQSRGHEVSLVSTKVLEKFKFNGPSYEVPGFYLPGAKESMQNMDFLCASGDKKILRKAFEGADLVQIQFPFFVARNSVRVAKKMNIPVMGACHIQTQNMTGAMGKDNKVLDWMINSWFNFELFNRVDAIHCPSEFAADLTQSKGSKSHLRVISNGIPRQYKPMDNPKRPEDFGDKFVLMNVGRHAMEKHQEILINAVLKSQYKDKIKLLVCGKGETTEKLIELGKQLPIEPIIRYISDEEKLLYLNTADMYLHSSGVELESLSCLEAMGCGLPCVIEDSPNSASSQFVLNDNLMFKTVDELTAKIDYWYENRALLSEMGDRTLKFAENYRMEKSIVAMEQLYSDVINSHNGTEGLLPEGVHVTSKNKPKLVKLIPSTVKGGVFSRLRNYISPSQNKKMGS